MAFMDEEEVTNVEDVPKSLLFRGEVVSVKNIPKELAKEVRVKVSMSQKMEGKETQWQSLGQTKAWCPKGWKPQKQNQAPKTAPRANSLRQSTVETRSISSQILATPRG